MTVDIHKVVEEDQVIHDMHASAELFPPAVEYAFRYLQVSALAAVAPIKSTTTNSNTCLPAALLCLQQVLVAVSRPEIFLRFLKLRMSHLLIAFYIILHFIILYIL